MCKSCPDGACFLTGVHTVLTLATEFWHEIALNQPATAVFDDELASMYLEDGTKVLLCDVCYLSQRLRRVLSGRSLDP